VVIEETIRDYIIRSACLTRRPDDSDRLVEAGYVSSVRLLDLVGFLENTFEIRLRALDLVPEKLATIGGIATLVRARIAATRR
jgi:acyl carrier protein